MACGSAPQARRRFSRLRRAVRAAPGPLNADVRHHANATCACTNRFDSSRSCSSAGHPTHCRLQRSRLLALGRRPPHRSGFDHSRIRGQFRFLVCRIRGKRPISRRAGLILRLKCTTSVQAVLRAYGRRRLVRRTWISHWSMPEGQFPYRVISSNVALENSAGGVADDRLSRKLPRRIRIW